MRVRARYFLTLSLPTCDEGSKHCMGDRPCVVDPVDVTAMALPGEAEPIVNYQDPNINISLPVFIIHGNHDDPCGQGQYSALDILSSAGLINYFGKQVHAGVRV
jgi:double-strand break repair protein MRE11